jgi:ribose transport system ATP-binding protein
MDARVTGNLTAQPAAPRLEMRGVRKRFGTTQALGGVDLIVMPGEVHALVGENGAGKSTLMKVLSGAHAPDEGAMFLDGHPYRPANPQAARLAGVAMIYQELSLAPHLTVEENIVLGMEPTRLGFTRRGEIRRKAAEALRQMEHPEIAPNRVVSRLSAAARQVVEIGRAIAIGCRVLVLDEPTSSLTRTDAEKLFDLIGRLRKQGIAIVYISHFLEEVKRVCDRYTVLRDGKTVGNGQVADVNADQIVQMMVGREIEDLYPRSHRTPGETILEVQHLAGPSKPADASLQLRRGEVLGIAGLVGAGRTELFRSLFGLDPVRNGSIRLLSYSGVAPPHKRWNQGMGLVSEDRKVEGLALNLSIADNLTMSRLKGFGPPGTVLPGRQVAAAQEWVRKLSVRCKSPKQPIGHLSGGNQQKVAIARLLHHDVDVLLLDEPTRGIDVASKAQIYQLIDDLASGRDGKPPRAILVISSYLPELMGICDRIHVMCRGRLGPAHPVADTTDHKLLMEATGNDAA